MSSSRFQDENEIMMAVDSWVHNTLNLIDEIRGGDCIRTIADELHTLSSDSRNLGTKIHQFADDNGYEDFL